MKVISCGSIIVNNDRVLIAKPYENKTWNIPKGKVEPGEVYYDAAIRETLEECNIDIRKGTIIRDLGKFKYLRDKDLYLFLTVIGDTPEMKCNSFFLDKKKGIEVPEMVDFKWIEFDNYRKYFSKNLSSVFDEVIPLIKLHLNK